MSLPPYVPRPPVAPPAPQMHINPVAPTHDQAGLLRVLSVPMLTPGGVPSGSGALCRTQAPSMSSVLSSPKPVDRGVCSGHLCILGHSWVQGRPQSPQALDDWLA